ncbi:MAG: glycosyltransferase family 39 protein [Anaerolineae bacterium]|nr:glycosyltransferase family 39 protein [Anaerolineae bacterium]
MNQQSSVSHTSTLIGRWYFAITVLLLITAAFFRLWDLGTAPPGMSAEELLNAQLSDHIREGNVSVIYDQPQPAREGLYYALLAASTSFTGRGLILWRLPSVWLAMFSLAVTAALTRRLFGARISLMALGLMAIAFWPVWMGRTVMHVTLMPLMTTLVLYALVRGYQSQQHTIMVFWFTLGGIALGMAQYVHVSAWTLIVIPVLFVLYRLLVNRHEMRRHWFNIFYVIILVLVVIVPLLIYLSRHPGAREPVPVAEQSQLLADIPGRVLAALTGVVLRGDMFPNHNLPGRPALGPLTGMLMIIGIGVSAVRWRKSAYGLALIWLASGLLPTALLPRSPDFEYMVVILPVLFVFPAIGLQSIYQQVKERLNEYRQPQFELVIAAIVALVISVNAIWTYRDYFIIWPELGDVRLNHQADLGLLAHYLDTNQDPTPISICSTAVDKVNDPFALSNKELLSYFMHRHNLPIRYFDCDQSLILASGGEPQRLIFPRGHYYDHLPGPLLAWMRYASNEHVPGIRPDVIMRLDIDRELADVVGAFMTTAPVAWAPETGESRMAPLPTPFGYNVTFLGYTVRDLSVQPGDYVELTTYWRLDGPSPPELTMFAHMLGDPVVVLAQNDNLGVNVAQLQVRDVFIQYSLIQTPTGTAPGLYPLSVGLYLPSSGARLQVFENGEARGDRLFLERVAVEPQ